MDKSLENKVTYNSVNISAAKGGWIIRHGKTTEVFVRWEAAINRLAVLLTSQGDQELN